MNYLGQDCAPDVTETGERRFIAQKVDRLLHALQSEM